MAGFADLTQGLIRGLADPLTKSLQPAILHKAWIGQDGFGKDKFAAVKTRHALVDRTQKPYRTTSGVIVMTLAVVTVLEKALDTTPMPGQTRQNPFDPRDQILLSDGATAPIVDIRAGLENPVSGRPYFNEIVLGTAK